MTSVSTTLFRNGRVYCPALPGATALLVAGDRISWLGLDGDAPAAGRTVDLDGAVVTPAFVDAHVHATDTGLVLQGLDLSGVRTAGELCEAVAARAARLPAGAVLFGHGWDESTWPEGQRTPPDAALLDRVAGGRWVYLSQASIHSCLVSSALLAAAQGVEAAVGYDPSGWLRRDAHHAVRGLAFGRIGPEQRAGAQRVALERAAALGVAAVHECGGPGTSSEDDFARVLALSGDGVPEVYGYWGEALAAGKARELGAVGAGGDLYADGALGSRTAHLSDDYVGGGRGYGYLTDELVCAHLLDCDAHGVQGGFHAIGDAAIGTVLAGFGLAALKLGVERLRAARHRVEHAEILDKRLIGGFVEYGVVASVQPAFDRLWGGPERMYSQRLGVRRALDSNPLGALHSVGVTMAFGSDSPVTPMDPWGAVKAAVCHHNPVQRLGVRAAFAAHTRGGWRAVGAGWDHSGHGVLVPGAPATFAVWGAAGGVREGLPALVSEGHDLPDPELPVCLRTVLNGRTIFEGS